MPEARVVLITGASSGIGLAAARRFLKNGDTVYGISRRPYESGGVNYIQADVTEPEQVRRAVAQIIAEQGRIDLLINNAGFGISGAVEFTSPEDAKRQMDVNFFGAFHCMAAVLPYMRAQKSGCILSVSSVAAVVSIPYQAFYSAAKASINQLTLAVANEARPYRIRVSALMPGDVRTGFTAARKKNMAGLEAYPNMAASVEAMEHDEQTGMRPEYIAELLFCIAGKKNPKPLYATGLKYKFFVMLQKLLPVRLVNWLVGQIYAK